MDLVRNSFNDERLKLIHHDENLGCVISRLDGIAEASGDWILFLDSDDRLVHNCCLVLSETIKLTDNSVEIIGFGITNMFTIKIADELKQVYERLLGCPVLGFLSGERLLDELYLYREKSWALWNRCYSAELASRVEKLAVRERLVQAEDFYLSFLFCHQAKNILVLKILCINTSLE